MTNDDQDAARNVYVGSEVRMHFDSSGQVRAKHSAAAYANWKPFVAAFERVYLVARIDLSESSEDGPLVEGPGVSVIGLPYYHGMRGMLLRMPDVMRSIRKIGTKQDLFIGRLPEPDRKSVV